MEVINMFFKRKQQQNSNNEEHSSPRANEYSEQLYQNVSDENDWDFSENYHQQDWENSNQTLDGDSLRQNHHYPDNNDDLYIGNHYMGPAYGEDNDQFYTNPSMEQDDQYQVYYQEEGYEPIASSNNTHYSDELAQDNSEIRGKRAKYHAKIDQFLTNGIIIVGVLLLAVLLIAFLG